MDYHIELTFEADVATRRSPIGAEEIREIEQSVACALNTLALLKRWKVGSKIMRIYLTKTADAAG